MASSSKLGTRGPACSSLLSPFVDEMMEESSGLWRLEAGSLSALMELRFEFRRPDMVKSSFTFPASVI
jgi:hypothetical protein